MQKGYWWVGGIWNDEGCKGNSPAVAKGRLGTLPVICKVDVVFLGYHGFGRCIIARIKMQSKARHKKKHQPQKFEEPQTNQDQQVQVQAH